MIISKYHSTLCSLSIQKFAFSLGTVAIPKSNTPFQGFFNFVMDKFGKIHRHH